MAVGGLSGTFGQMTGGLVRIIFIVIGIIIFFVVLGVVLVIKKRKQRYNIPVTIWIPRSDGKIIDEISAVGGYFKSKNNVTTFRLKRKGLPTIDIPPPSSRFLVGLRRKVYLIQKGMDDFEPVLPDSFRYITTAAGKKIQIIDLKCINQDATAWVEDNRENAKRRFTLKAFWEKYKDLIQMSVFVLIFFIAVFITWKGLADVVVGLEKVAEQLGGRPIVKMGLALLG